jgi:hypothetical protein
VKRKLSTLQAMRALVFAMTPIYLAYKQMDWYSLISFTIHAISIVSSIRPIYPILNREKRIGLSRLKNSRLLFLIIALLARKTTHQISYLLHNFIWLLRRPSHRLSRFLLVLLIVVLAIILPPSFLQILPQLGHFILQHLVFILEVLHQLFKLD